MIPLPEDNDPDYDWDEELICGHTPRFHKGEIEKQIQSIFGLSLKEFNKFSKFMHRIGINLETVVVRSRDEAVDLILSKAPDEVRDSFIEGFVDLLEKEIHKYHKDKSLAQAQRVILIAQKLENIFKWDLCTFRHDLWGEVNNIVARHWRDLVKKPKV